MTRGHFSCRRGETCADDEKGFLAIGERQIIFVYLFMRHIFSNKVLQNGIKKFNFIIQTVISWKLVVPIYSGNISSHPTIIGTIKIKNHIFSYFFLSKASCKVIATESWSEVIKGGMIKTSATSCLLLTKTKFAIFLYLIGSLTSSSKYGKISKISVDRYYLL